MDVRVVAVQCWTKTKERCSYYRSGILFGRDIVLTLAPVHLLAHKYIERKFDRLRVQKGLALSRILNDLFEYEMYEEDSPDEILQPGVTRPGRTVTVAAAWQSPEVEEFLRVGSRRDHTLKDGVFHMMSVFVFLRPPDGSRMSYSQIADILNVVSLPARGQGVLVESIPFAELSMIGMITRGVVSNAFGQRNSIFFTDAVTAPNSEGGVIFSADHSRIDGKGSLLGMVFFSDFQKTSFTIGVALLPILQRVMPPPFIRAKYPRGRVHDRVVDIINETVVLVNSGNFMGSGIVVDAKLGIILTCSHVITEDESITVTHMGKSYPSRLVYKTCFKKNYDLAVIRTVSENCFKKRMEIADTPAQTGMTVLAAGYLTVLNDVGFSKKPHITIGCVSHTSPSRILTSCYVDHGFSGGAIVQSDGRLLGLIVCILKSGDSKYNKMNYSIPAPVFREYIERYIATDNVGHLQNIGSSIKLATKLWMCRAANL